MAIGIGGLARWGMLINPKLRGHAVWQVPLDSVHTYQWDISPPDKLVPSAHVVHLETPAFVVIRPPVNPLKDW